MLSAWEVWGLKLEHAAKMCEKLCTSEIVYWILTSTENFLCLAHSLWLLIILPLPYSIVSVLNNWDNEIILRLLRLLSLHWAYLGMHNSNVQKEDAGSNSVFQLLFFRDRSSTSGYIFWVWIAFASLKINLNTIFSKIYSKHLWANKASHKNLENREVKLSYDCKTLNA